MVTGMLETQHQWSNEQLSALSGNLKKKSSVVNNTYDPNLAFLDIGMVIPLYNCCR